MIANIIEFLYVFITLVLLIIGLFSQDVPIMMFGAGMALGYALLNLIRSFS